MVGGFDMSRDGYVVATQASLEAGVVVSEAKLLHQQSARCRHEVAAGTSREAKLIMRHDSACRVQGNHGVNSCPATSCGTRYD